MSKRILSLAACIVLVGFVIVGCPRADLAVNEIPSGEQLEQYNRAITQIESAIERED